jgi:uncharacterized protein DUF1501
MLTILGQTATTCDGVSRRDVLRAGALSLFGTWLTAPTRAAERPASGGRARSVVLFNLFGGPSHLDMFDLKPSAPAEIRGEFRPIDSSLPGVQICEYLPRIARQMHRATLIRTLSHGYNSHNPYAVMTGFAGGNDRENYFSKPNDHPSMGAVCQYLGVGRRDVPTHVCTPSHPGWSQGLRRAGPYGGYLGSQYDPLITQCDPKLEHEPKDFYDPVVARGVPHAPLFTPPSEVTVDRLRGRQSLLEQLDEQFLRIGSSKAVDVMHDHQRRAFDMLTSDRMRSAFDVEREPAQVRERYGDSLIGSSTLLARRLVEAGVTFVTVTTEATGSAHWDTHANNFKMLRNFNLPQFDRIFSALVDDLEERGLLETTLVVAMGDMGRTPRINRNAGRDHWPQCGFCLLAGGGTKAGFVLGATDRTASSVVERPVSPGDIVATIYDRLGVDPTTTVHDLTDRPFSISHGGAPIREIFA